LSYIYFIRHAQAGTRDNYDVLSELGHRQAALLGQYFASQGASFRAVYSGTMRRQRHTAEIVLEALRRTGARTPDIASDERWNEFSLAVVYRAVERRLIEESEEFARDFQEMQEALRVDPRTTGGATGRCDAAVVRAWMQSRYPDVDGESWPSFCSRVRLCAAELQAGEGGGDIAVFTSATPIALLTGASLALNEEKMLSLLGVIHNTSITVMKMRDEELRLYTYNATPHLTGSERTYR
jgi:broad specificity phosphatase PhoE